jgi:hypothetical protein
MHNIYIKVYWKGYISKEFRNFYKENKEHGGQNNEHNKKLKKRIWYVCVCYTERTSLINT